MEQLSSIYLQRLHGRLGEVLYEYSRLRFSRYGGPEAWCPAINAFRCPDRIAICIDLAGVDQAAIDIQVEPRRLLVRGRREAPEPAGEQGKAVQVLALEIDYGNFERRLELPAEVDPQQVTAEQQNGLLWIHLLLAAQS